MSRNPNLLMLLALALAACGIPLEDESVHDIALYDHTIDLEAAPEFVPMQAIVKFRENEKNATQAPLANVVTLEALPLNTSLVHFDAEVNDDHTQQAKATWALIHELREREDVEYAHPNYLFELSRVPNDPLYPNQWHYPAIQLPQAWDLTTGSSGIRIAILDTGRTGHEDLASRWVPGLEYDAAVQDGNAENDPGNTWRHGIHVAGIAGGASHNSRGSAGVCWGCELLNVKVAQNHNINFASVIRGIHWAVENGAQVINMSFESNGQPCSHVDASGMRDAVAFAIGRNVTVVAAAGNHGADAANTVPASCPGVIAVAATDRNNTLAQYSNRGAVTLAAPGGGATLVMGSKGPEIGPDGRGPGIGCPDDPASYFGPSDQGAVATWTTSNNGHCYRYLSGTSMAAPHVAGVVGLMLSRNPSLSPSQVRQILQATAQPLPGCAGNCGAGLLNAFGAVQQAAPLPINDANPIPRFTFQCSGLQCTFDGRNSTDDRGIVSFQWRFPGQQTRAGATTSFFMPGYLSHTVRLRVTDTAGQIAEIAQTINPTQPLVTPVQGAYYNPQRSGNGIDLFETSTGDWHVTWYTYEPGGTPVWYTSGTGPKSTARWSQPLYRATWNGASATLTEVGTVSLDFASSTLVWFSWILNGVRGGERFVYLAGGQGRSGAWYVPSESGWGISVQESGSFLGASVAFYNQGQPRWVQGTTAPGSTVTIPLTYYKGPGLCPSCEGSEQPQADRSWNSSSMNLQILDGASTTGQASTDIKIDGWYPVWRRSLQTIHLLTKP
jgi:subtilisin family serine protease